MYSAERRDGSENGLVGGMRGSHNVQLLDAQAQDAGEPLARKAAHHIETCAHSANKKFASPHTLAQDPNQKDNMFMWVHTSLSR